MLVFKFTAVPQGRVYVDVIFFPVARLLLMTAAKLLIRHN